MAARARAEPTLEEIIAVKEAWRATLEALVAAIRQLGGEVRELQEPRTDGDPKQASARPVDDRPGDDRQHVGAVIWATGVAGLAALSSDLGQPVGSGIKGQAARFACRAADRPQLFVDGLHIVPHADGSVAEW